MTAVQQLDGMWQYGHGELAEMMDLAIDVPNVVAATRKKCQTFRDRLSLLVYLETKLICSHDLVSVYGRFH